LVCKTPWDTKGIGSAQTMHVSGENKRLKIQ
jgi:hypothetical protein